MGKREKLIAQFLKQPPEVSFDDVRYLLKTFDFEEKSVKGSHHTFRNSKGLKITIPKKRDKMVKRVYVQQIIKLLNLDK